MSFYKSQIMKTRLSVRLSQSCCNEIWGHMDRSPEEEVKTDAAVIRNVVPVVKNGFSWWSSVHSGYNLF